MPDDGAAATPGAASAALAARRAPHAHAGVAAVGRAARPPQGHARAAARSCAAGRCGARRRSRGLGTLTVLTIDMSSAACPAVDADALMTDGDTVYASQDRLYVASQRWLGVGPDARARSSTSPPPACTRSRPTTAGETAYVGSGEVPGYLLNQWSLSEHEGDAARGDDVDAAVGQPARAARARCARCEERDGRLVQVGAVGGLGEGERIYAVRFMGDTGFVVTFRQIDPLYTLDLSDPRAPRVVGELKVPGLLGLPAPGRRRAAARRGPGRDGGGPRAPGVQLSLFDVSDLAQADAARPGGASGRGLLHGGRGATTRRSSGGRRSGSRSSRRSSYAQTTSARRSRGSLAFRVDRAGGIAARRADRAPGADGFGDLLRPLGRGRRPAAARLVGRGVLSTFARRARRRAQFAAPTAADRKFRAAGCVAAPMTPLPKALHSRWRPPAPRSPSPRRPRWPSSAAPTPARTSSPRSPR